MPRQLPANFFRRVDDDDDEVFYSVPRLVTHIDDGAIAKVGEIYAQLLPQGGVNYFITRILRRGNPERLSSRRAF